MTLLTTTAYKFCWKLGSILTIVCFGIVFCFSCEVEQGISMAKDQLNESDSLLLIQADKIIAIADGGDVDSAQKLLETFDLSSFSSYRSKAKFYYLNGYILDYQGRFQESVDAYQKGITQLEENEDFANLDLPLLYNDMAYVYGEMYIQPLERLNYGKAFKYIKSYHPTDTEHLSSMYMNYIQTLVDYGDLQKARNIRTWVQENVSTISEPLHQFRFFLAEAAFLRSSPETIELERLQKEIDEFLSRQTLEVKENYANYTFYTLDAIGNGFLNLKKYDKAKEIFEELKRSSTNMRNSMKAESNLASYYVQQKEYIKAAEACKRSLEIFNGASDNINTLMLWAARSRMLSKAGLQKKATLECQRMWENYFKSSLSSRLINETTIIENSNRWLYILLSS